MAKFKIAILSDVHYGFNVRDKLGSYAPQMLNKFAQAAQKFQPDYIIDLGDRFTCVDRETDAYYLKKYKAHFNHLSAKQHHILGNHEYKHLSRKTLQDILGTPAKNYSITHDDAELLFWNPKPEYKKNGIELKEKDISWLKNTLTKHHDKKHILLFTHAPLDSQHNEEIEHRTKRYFFWSQNAEIRSIIENAGNVRLVMNGHLHRDRYNIVNDIHYVTLQSLTAKHPAIPYQPLGAFCHFEMNEHQIKLNLKGYFESEITIDLPEIIQPKNILQNNKSRKPNP